MTDEWAKPLITDAAKNITKPHDKYTVLNHIFRVNVRETNCLLKSQNHILKTLLVIVNHS